MEQAETLRNPLATEANHKPQGRFEYQSETGHLSGILWAHNEEERIRFAAGASLGDRWQALMDWQQAKAQGSPREAELLAELERIESYYPANPTKKPHQTAGLQATP